MKLQLSKLQDKDKEAITLRAAGLSKDWKDVKGVLEYQGLPYVPEIIRSKVISYHHNNLLAEHFGINKRRKLVGRKYYWPSLRKNIETYVRGCNMCLVLKAVRHKPYGDLQFLPILTHQWKNLLIDFVTNLLLFAN